MLAIVLVILFVIASSHWLLEPLVRLATPLFDLSWLGWLLLAGLIWIFAGR
jgi:hypothetical protein